MAEKAKYWTAILYPDSMIDNWEDKISDIFQVPVAYCIHDKDKDGHDGDRKTHVHFELAFPNTTTFKHVLGLVQEVQPTCKIVKKVINVRYMYDYLIHDTDSCKKAGKHLYKSSERILLNNFDIGCYEQRSLEDKRKDAIDLKNLIIAKMLENAYELDRYLSSDPNIDEDTRNRFEEVLLCYSGYINNICKGVYLHNCKMRNINSYYGDKSTS